jgi:transcriptional regulator with XRE-family HTH domain
MDSVKEIERETLDMRDTGWKLRQIREAQNKRVSEVAENLGLSGQSVYNWEIGKTKLDVEHLVMLCKFYNKSYDEVIQTKKEKALIKEYDE